MTENATPTQLRINAVRLQVGAVLEKVLGSLSEIRKMEEMVETMRSEGALDKLEDLLDKVHQAKQMLRDSMNVVHELNGLIEPVYASAEELNLL